MSIGIGRQLSLIGFPLRVGSAHNRPNELRLRAIGLARRAGPADRTSSRVACDDLLRAPNPVHVVLKKPARHAEGHRSVPPPPQQ